MRDNIMHPYKRAAAHGQRPHPLSQSLSALPAPPKWEPLAVHANSISLPRPLPLGEVSPQVTERASTLKKKHPQQLFADFLKSRSDCYRCFYFIRYYVMQKERLLVILLSVLRVIQMLAPFACQCGAQLQQCKAQDAGKNTGKSGTDPVSTGKPDD